MHLTPDDGVSSLEKMLTTRIGEKKVAGGGKYDGHKTERRLPESVEEIFRERGVAHHLLVYRR
jgi:hypothetical protein